MEIDEHGRVHYEWRRPRHPDDGRETQRAGYPACEYAAHSRHEKKDRRDRDAAQECDYGRKHVAATVFRSPGIGRQPLEPMKHETHPEPAREDRQNSSDRAGSESKLQCFHNAEADVEISAPWFSLSRSEF